MDRTPAGPRPVGEGRRVPQLLEEEDEPGSLLVAQLLESLPVVGPAASAVQGVHDCQTSLGRGGALRGFLAREAQGLSRVDALARAGLQSLAAVLAGRSALSEDLETALAALLLRRVPDAWALPGGRRGQGIGTWLEGFQRRAEMVVGWAGLPPTEPPPFFSMSRLASPEGLLTSVRRDFARRRGVNGLPFKDMPAFRHNVMSSLGNVSEAIGLRPPENGIYVSGLYIEGGRWDIHTAQVEDCRPGELSSPMPVVHFELCEERAPRLTVQAGESADACEVARAAGMEGEDIRDSPTRYSCPLYKFPRRLGASHRECEITPKAFCAVELPTTAALHQWALRGTALACDRATE